MEIEKDKRLPVGCSTWNQFAGHIPNQDFLQANVEQEPFPFVWSDLVIEESPGVPTHETFEIDSLTLKMRCFDELKEVLPGELELQEFMSKALMCSYTSAGSRNGPDRDPYEDPLYKFLCDLAKVLYPKRY